MDSLRELNFEIVLFHVHDRNDILLEWYVGAMLVNSTTFSKAVVLSIDYLYEPFSTKNTVDSIAGSALSKTAICFERKEIVLVYHLCGPN